MHVCMHGRLDLGQKGMHEFSQNAKRKLVVHGNPGDHAPSG